MAHGLVHRVIECTLVASQVTCVVEGQVLLVHSLTNSNAKVVLLLVVQIVNCKVRVVLELIMQPIQAVQVLLSVVTKTALVLPVQLVRIKIKPVKLNVKIVLQALLQGKQHVLLLAAMRVKLRMRLAQLVKPILQD